ncbi:matrix remodeling-associated protein 8 isoform X1 [Phocoena sinus]|uniref:matrix remodeling-associated protein 8 isoform X1 n=1 Tax=Phocoena sinus TaxID=42100 RepID=UPI0013C470FE|nr:matrix remodeling-associated protein 8 isoform X1 [Phocoena sinus]
MVWTQDRLHDRQRVVHWDLSGGPAGGPARRLMDMYSAGEQRVYEPRDSGRLLLTPSAFQDGNFSLLIRAVEDTDEGLYTCNLHHHYCHLYESLAVRLEVTDDPRAAGAHWDGEKEVLAVERGAPALLTCVNRAHVWTDRHLEEAQQVVHWDRQPPGVPHDRADRLLDLYASGERRAYGPPFLRERVAVGADAFARGDFSLRIDPLEPADEGTYSCHLHHHYCGLHERRVFHLKVTEPVARPPPRDSPGNGSSHSGAPGPGAGDPTLTRGRSVINVIVPEGRAHFFQQLGYVLATLLLFILLLITVILATRQRRRGGYEYSDKKSKSKGKDVNMVESAVAAGDQALYRREDIRLGYKNNLLKERVELSHSPLPAKSIDLDKGELRCGGRPLPISELGCPLATHSEPQGTSQPCGQESPAASVPPKSLGSPDGSLPCFPRSRGAEGRHPPVPLASRVQEGVLQIRRPRAPGWASSSASSCLSTPEDSS